MTREASALTLNHMVNHGASLDATFGALADPTRRALIAVLAAGETSVTDLARPHPMSLPAVMKHLAVLERAGLVQQRKEGRVRHIRLSPAPLQEATGWLEQYRAFWELQLDSLAHYLSESPTEEKKSEWHLQKQQQHRVSNSHADSRRTGKGSSGRGPKRTT